MPEGGNAQGALQRVFNRRRNSPGKIKGGKRERGKKCGDTSVVESKQWEREMRGGRKKSPITLG